MGTIVTDFTLYNTVLLKCSSRDSHVAFTCPLVTLKISIPYKLFYNFIPLFTCHTLILGLLLFTMIQILRRMKS